MDQVRGLPDKAINEELFANGYIHDLKEVRKKDKIEAISVLIKRDDLTRYVPPTVIHTETFREEVLDPVLVAEAVTGKYRISFRKLMKLPFANLQEQARLLDLNTVDKDEIRLSREILEEIHKRQTSRVIDNDKDVPLTQLLKQRLLRTEIAYYVGVGIQIEGEGRNLRGTVHLYPDDMVTSDILTKNDIEAECRNQSLVTSRNDTPRKLSVRLVAHFQNSPDRIRLPFTSAFEDFLQSKLEGSRT